MIIATEIYPGHYELVGDQFMQLRIDASDIDALINDLESTLCRYGLTAVKIISLDGSIFTCCINHN